jgi:hypothetical protein
MANPDYTTAFLVNQTPTEAFNAINNVRGWWTENLQGKSQKLNDEFTVRFGDVHMSTQKLVEVIPGKKVVWLVTDSQINFVSDKSEWTNTRIIFEVTEVGDKTQVRFTHVGLAPDVACFDACSNAWSEYIHESLFRLITTGKGRPTTENKQEARA